VDNNSADVMSSSRSFQVRGPTTGKVGLVGDGRQLDQRHCQTVGACRTERSAARNIRLVLEWVKILRQEQNTYLMRSLVIFS